MAETILLILTVSILLPFVSYLTAKLVTLGILNARKHFNRKENPDE